MTGIARAAALDGQFASDGSAKETRCRQAKMSDRSV
jgi:hypothetical protein